MRGDYLRTLDIWEKKFPPGQFFIGFYDDIRTRPAHLLNSIFGFLGLDDQAPHTAAQPRKVHPTKEVAMPTEIEVYLARKYLLDLEQLSARFGGHTEQWYADAAAILN